MLVLNMSQYVTEFLVRPSPLEGEALSSWRQRCGWANGYKLFPTPDERTRRVDSDLGLQPDVYEWLAKCHRIDIVKIYEMTLRKYVGICVEPFKVRQKPMWWLNSRYGLSSVEGGPMFCPTCLCEDEIPYFRLEWRFGFVTTCLKHKSLLVDQCPLCHARVWPSGIGSKQKISPGFVSFSFCWSCAADFRNITPVQHDSEVVKILFASIEQGLICLGSEIKSIVDVLMAIRATSQIFLRNRSRFQIESSGSTWALVAASVSQEGVRLGKIDSLQVHDRSLLLDAAWAALSNWPESFTRFCEDANLNRLSFDGARSIQPEWMNRYVDDKYPPRKISIPSTQEQIKSYVQEWQKAKGDLPLKYELRNRFGERSNGVIDALLARRTVATKVEFDLLLVEFERSLEDAKQTQLGYKHIIFDHAGILLCLLEHRQLHDIVKIPPSVIVSELKSWNQKGLNQNLIRIINHVIQEATLIQELKILKQINELSYRQLLKRLKRLMDNFDQELLRNILVFNSHLMQPELNIGRSFTYPNDLERQCR